MNITVEVSSFATGRTYLATFTYEQQAIDFITARLDTHLVREAELHPLPEVGMKLYGLLYPKCEHGMSADLCAGPQHYPYDDDELRAMGYWSAR